MRVTAEKRRKFDAEFREGAMRIVTGTGKPVAQVAQDLVVNETTPARWVSRARRAGRTAPGDKDALIARLPEENKQSKKDVKELGRKVMSSNAAWSCG